MKDLQLVFIPGPGIGHLVSAIQMGELLINQDERLCITFLIIQLPFDTGVNDYLKSLTTDASSRMRFISLPSSNTSSTSKSRDKLSFDLISASKPRAKEVIVDMMRSKSGVVSCIIVDMFSVKMIDLAHELGLSSYVFFTSSAGFLGLMLHAHDLRERYKLDITEYKNSDSELSVKSFINPVPSKVLPSAMVDNINGGSVNVLYTAGKIKDSTGIMINTFTDLEPYPIQSLSDGNVPPVYPIGPIINLGWQKSDDGIINWLERQPDSSVLFLCFGSYGYFNEEQVKQIALALERSGCRFLWSLKWPPQEGEFGVLSGYETPEEVLPEGFLSRTSSIGRVTGWVPQAEVLSHKSVGGFISHCGWNSILESIWFGVPIAAWPLYAEQQINAFQIVVDLGLAVNIKMEYNMDKEQLIVTAEEIEIAMRRLMMNSHKRKKMKDLQEKSRKALTQGGSSYNSLEHLVNEMLHNISKKQVTS